MTTRRRVSLAENPTTNATEIASIVSTMARPITTARIAGVLLLRHPLASRRGLEMFAGAHLANLGWRKARLSGGGVRTWEWVYVGPPSPPPAPVEEETPPEVPLPQEDATIVGLDSVARLGATHHDIEIRVACKALLRALARYARRTAAPVPAHSP